MEVPPKNCMVYNGISFEHGWFRCTPISGNLHMLEKGLKHVAWWMSRWKLMASGWPARWKHETAVESVHIYVRLLETIETIQNHTQSRQSANTAAAFTTGGVANLDTMTRWHDDDDDNNNSNNNNTNTSNSNSSSSTTAPTVPRWQPWRSTSCWWCRKRRQERRSPLGHKSGWMDEWCWMILDGGRNRSMEKREVKGISSLGTGLQWYAWYRLIARFEISTKVLSIGRNGPSEVKARKSQLLEWHPDKTAAPEAAEVTRRSVLKCK